MNFFSYTFNVRTPRKRVRFGITLNCTCGGESTFSDVIEGIILKCGDCDLEYKFSHWRPEVVVMPIRDKSLT